MPLYPRAIIWTVFVIAILIALVLATCTLAGSLQPPRQRWTLFTFAFLATLAAHADYLAAPFVLGRSGWPLYVALALMAPVALAIAATFITPVYLALFATRPDGGSGWKSAASIAPPALICLALYALPPTLLLLFRHQHQ